MPSSGNYCGTQEKTLLIINLYLSAPKLLQFNLLEYFYPRSTLTLNYVFVSVISMAFSLSVTGY